MSRDEKIVLSIILVAAAGAILVPVHIHLRSQERELERGLEQIRPEVVSAVEAYRAEHGRYPTSLTNAIPLYYHGPEEGASFFELYRYQNWGTNFYLKHFSE